MLATVIVGLCKCLLLQMLTTVNVNPTANATVNATVNVGCFFTTVNVGYCGFWQI